MAFILVIIGRDEKGCIMDVDSFDNVDQVEKGSGRRPLEKSRMVDLEWDNSSGRHRQHFLWLIVDVNQ